MFSTRFFIFLCPNTSNSSFNWDYGVLRSQWDIYLLVMLVLTILAYLWFYYLTYPDRKALRRFTLLTLGLLVIGGVSAWPYLYHSRDVLMLNSAATWTITNTLVTICSGLESTFVLISLVLLVFPVLLGRIPFAWQLRAMRRYPFKSVK